MSWEPYLNFHYTDEQVENRFSLQINQETPENTLKTQKNLLGEQEH